MGTTSLVAAVILFSSIIGYEASRNHNAWACLIFVILSMVVIQASYFIGAYLHR